MHHHGVIFRGNRRPEHAPAGSFTGGVGEHCATLHALALPGGVLMAVASPCSSADRLTPSNTTGDAYSAVCQDLCRVQDIEYTADNIFAVCCARQRMTHGLVTNITHGKE